MSHETFALVVQTATPFLLACLGLFFAWLSRKVNAATKNQQLAHAIDLLASGAQGVVADISQHIVQDLKDPNKPGTWDAVAKESVRNTAILRLKQLYPSAIRELEAANPAKVQEVLGTLVEAAVLKYKRP